jgi:hypothetical protein
VKPLGPEEEGARTMVEQTLGLSVFQHDDGSDDGMYDLKVVRDGAIVAAMEVTIAAEQKSIELSVPLSRLANLHGGVWTDGRLRGGWFVTVDAARTRVKDLSSGLPALLAELEATNRPSLDREYDSEADALATRAAELGVLFAWQSGTTSKPGSIYTAVDTRGLAGFVAETGDAVATWIGGFLEAQERQDVRQKLGASGVEARHAFVWVPLLFTTAPFGVVEVLTRRTIPLPTVAPELPTEVTDVWVASTWDGGLRWAPGQGWSSFHVTPQSSPSPAS